MRPFFLQKVQKNFQIHRITAILGPRQCGKTTLAREYAKKIPSENYFDLENPLDLAKLENPKLALENLKGLIVIDEIQRRPDLLPVLRYLHDLQKDQQYLILGSAFRELIAQFSETLAGRIGYIELTPFNFLEVENTEKLWRRGGFPRSYLATSDDVARRWITDYIKTFLERDIPMLGINIPPNQLRRFWVMLAHYHGNLLNFSDLGRSLDLSHTTIKKYADILVSTFMVRLLQPWHENISKRQVKMPKIYVRDSGIVHGILNIEDPMQHPKLGAFFEGFAVEQLLTMLDPWESFFWATHGGAELDLFIPDLKGKKVGFEIKYTDSPSITASMRVAIEDLKLDELYCIIPGDSNFKLDEKIRVLGLKAAKTFFH